MAMASFNILDDLEKGMASGFKQIGGKRGGSRGKQGAANGYTMAKAATSDTMDGRCFEDACGRNRVAGLLASAQAAIFQRLTMAFTKLVAAETRLETGGKREEDAQSHNLVTRRTLVLFI